MTDDVVTRESQGKQRLELALQELGQQPLPSPDATLSARVDDPVWLGQALLSFGFPAQASTEAAELRLWLPTATKEQLRLEEAIRTALAPEALILDMDGVIADVSRSYRAAVGLTCKAFGLTVSPEQVLQAKAAGNANNDWLLCQSMLARAGRALPFETVRDQFESYYQGRGDKAGLWTSERLIPAPDLLPRLAARLPLAVVTGRPRRDAERFVALHDLESSIATMVCMEDAPGKPAPDGVCLALRQLGVKRAWMVGDTPDDMRAARAAGVIAVGVTAPGDSEAVMGPALREAGAARVLKGLQALEGMLR